MLEKCLCHISVVRPIMKCSGFHRFSQDVTRGGNCAKEGRYELLVWLVMTFCCVV